MKTSAKQLSAKDSPAGDEPLVRDITFYTAWGNLAQFCRDFAYAGVLMGIGKNRRWYMKNTKAFNKRDAALKVQLLY